MGAPRIIMLHNHPSGDPTPSKADIEVTKETSYNQTLLMRYKDLEDSYFQLQESKYDIEIELIFMQKRIEELDPEYNNMQTAFRKLVNMLSALNMSFDQIKYAFANFSPCASEQL